MSHRQSIIFYKCYNNNDKASIILADYQNLQVNIQHKKNDTNQLDPETVECHR